MSTQLNDVQFLATYGTLRDDDDSNAPWAKGFVEGINPATRSRVVGYQILGHPTIKYPYAIYTGNPNDSIVVRLLSWPSKEQFKQKIAEADIIEGRTYERKIIDILVDGKAQHAYIYIPKLEPLDDNWKLIPSGDWLRRNET